MSKVKCEAEVQLSFSPLKCQNPSATIYLFFCLFKLPKRQSDKLSIIIKKHTNVRKHRIKIKEFNDKNVTVENVTETYKSKMHRAAV